VLVAMSTLYLTLSRFKLVNIALITQHLIRFASSPLIFRNFLFFHQSNSTLFATKSFFSFAGDDQLPCNSRSLFTNSFKRSKSPAQDSLKFADISSQRLLRTPNSTFQLSQEQLPFFRQSYSKYKANGTVDSVDLQAFKAL
jgi:hypothetical protein